MTSSVQAYVTAAPVTPESRKFYSLLRGEDLMQVHSHALNIVLGRDLRRNVSYSAAMALELAASGKRVLYLNSYASEHLLRAAFGSSVPDEYVITVADVPTGTWDAEKIRPLAKEHDVLMLNSFEYASLTRSLKERVARELLDIFRETKITIVIFSHEMKRDLDAGCGARGALGVLAPYSASVSKIGEEWNVKPAAAAAAAPPRYSVEEWKESKAIHEKQMLRKHALPKKFGGERPNPSVDIENDRGFSYHYGDFWCDPFHRGPMVSYLGKDMALMARTPLLHQYLMDNPDTQFMIGNTPTEAQLMEGTWVRHDAPVRNVNHLPAPALESRG